MKSTRHRPHILGIVLCLALLLGMNAPASAFAPAADAEISRLATDLPPALAASSNQEKTSFGIASYFEAKGNTVASDPISMNQLKAPATNSASRFAARSIHVQNQPMDAVLEVETNTLYNGTVVYAPYMHWFQNGFRMCYIVHVTSTLEDATDVDDSVLSQLQFQDISLNQTASAQVK